MCRLDILRFARFWGLASIVRERKRLDENYNYLISFLGVHSVSINIYFRPKTTCLLVLHAASFQAGGRYGRSSPTWAKRESLADLEHEGGLRRGYECGGGEGVEGAAAAEEEEGREAPALCAFSPKQHTTPASRGLSWPPRSLTCRPWWRPVGRTGAPKRPSSPAVPG